LLINFAMRLCLVTVVIQLGADSIAAFAGVNLVSSSVRRQCKALSAAKLLAKRGGNDEVQYLRAVEEDYWKSLDPLSYKIARKQALGLELLRQGQLEASLEAYDAALAPG
jgi:hypothetical protein